MILKEKALNVCTANYRAPELHYGRAAYTNLIDEWSAGVVALETIRGVRWPVEGKAGAEKPAMRQVFGSAALRRLFGGAALFQTLEGGFPESGPGAAPGAELDGAGRHVMQSLLSLDPAARGQASELSKIELVPGAIGPPEDHIWTGRQRSLRGRRGLHGRRPLGIEGARIKFIIRRPWQA